MVTLLARLIGRVGAAVLAALIVPAAFVYRRSVLALELVAVVLFTVAAGLGSGPVLALVVVGVAALLKAWEIELRAGAKGDGR